MMTRAEFESDLRALGLSAAAFARITHTHPTTVCRWGGIIPAFPAWVPLLLDAWRIAGVPDASGHHVSM